MSKTEDLDWIELKALDGTIIPIKMDLSHFKVGEILEMSNNVKLKIVSETLLEEIK